LLIDVECEFVAGILQEDVKAHDGAAWAMQRVTREREDQRAAGGG